MRKWLLALAFSLFAVPAYAEDFTLTVPVAFTNLPPNIHTLWVTCQVMEETRARVTAVASREIAITGGAYRGDVVLAANASAGRDPALAVQYRCAAWVRGRTATNPNQSYFAVDASESMVERFPLAPSAPLLLDTGYVRLR